MPTGGELLVAAMKAQGVERVFCVPGESFLPILAALDGSGIDVITCRHESTAAMAAEATGKLTGRPGVALVTRAPGATNASAGVHVASHDATPMILIMGQVARSMRHRGAFQEIDPVSFFGGMARHVEEVHETARLPEAVSRAFHLAMADSPGPVVLSVPEDVLSGQCEAEGCQKTASKAMAAQPGPDEESMRLFFRYLEEAERPLIIAGGSRWTARARMLLMEMASALRIPVAVSFRRQMLCDPLHEAYAGDIGFALNPALKARIEKADLLILLGARMAEVPTQGYALLSIPHPRQYLIQIHASGREIGRVYHPDLGIQALPETFLDALARSISDIAVKDPAWMEEAHADYLAWSETPPPMPGAVDLGQVILHLRERMPDETIVTNGAGNYALWVHRFWRYRGWGTQLAPVSGSMGYGLPAAIAAKLAQAERPVICFAGDGCFQMTMQDFATAVQYGLGIIVIVADNGQYGTIRLHQARKFPGRDCATSLVNPDFASYARICGGVGLSVYDTDAFPEVLEDALAANQMGIPALIHLRIAPDALAPGLVLTKDGTLQTWSQDS